MIGSVNVLINTKGNIGKQNVASIYDGGHFGELALMGGTRKTKELIIDKIQTVKTKQDIDDYQLKEEKEKSISKKKLVLEQLKREDVKYKDSDEIIIKLEREIELDAQDNIKNAQKRLATIALQEKTVLLEIPRDEFKNILLSIYQQGMDGKLQTLAKIHFFKNNDQASLIPLANYLNVKKFKMGEVVIKEGDVLEDFFIIAKGRCKVLFLNKIKENNYIEKFSSFLLYHFIFFNRL